MRAVNIGYDRESPAPRVAELLLLKGADVVAVDPFDTKCSAKGMHMVSIAPETLGGLLMR